MTVACSTEDKLAVVETLGELAKFHATSNLLDDIDVDAAMSRNPTEVVQALIKLRAPMTTCIEVLRELIVAATKGIPGHDEETKPKKCPHCTEGWLIPLSIDEPGVPCPHCNKEGKPIG